MANMYLRVPHYVASYYRNRDEFKPIEIGKPVSLENEPLLWNMLISGLIDNPREKLVKEGCFCERMWRKMMRGQYLPSAHKGNLRLNRDQSLYLTDAEVRELSGMKSSVRSNSSEYLCVKLPPYIFYKGRQVAVDGQWQLTSFTCQIFITTVRRLFWESCIKYINNFIESGKAVGMNHSKAEGLERFLSRYDIRTGEDERDRKTMKRIYFRKVLNKPKKQYDFLEFGDTE